MTILYLRLELPKVRRPFFWNEPKPEMQGDLAVVFLHFLQRKESRPKLRRTI
jgi:hypothetical protein